MASEMVKIFHPGKTGYRAFSDNARHVRKEIRNVFCWRVQQVLPWSVQATMVTISADCIYVQQFRGWQSKTKDLLPVAACGEGGLWSLQRLLRTLIHSGARHPHD